MTKRHELAGVAASSRRNSRARIMGKACVEALEGRVLLAVTAAGSSTLPDLVVLRTTDTHNSITHTSSADAVDMGAYELDRAPTDLLLSSSTIAENQPVGTLSTTDPDTGDSFTYSLVSGTGSTDNGSSMVGVNDILLSSTSVIEGQLPGTVVADINPDGNALTYTLVSGVGADDNASFTIEGNYLKTAAVLSAAAKSSCLIRIRATDAGGLWVERAFEITVTRSGVPAVVWSSYLGGSAHDYGSGIALDGSGNAWVTGTTTSSDLAVGGFDTSYNGGTYYGDAFVAKINADGTLAWSSYLGGSGEDAGVAIALDASGNAWVTGRTSSAGWTSGGFDTSYNGGNDGFVAKINADGTLAWSSYLGVSGIDEGYSIAVDASGNAWVTGTTASSGWASGGFDTSYNGGYHDAFVAKINANGTLAWSSYLGGSGSDYGCSIALDAGGNAWVTGYTASGWAVGGFDTSYNGGYYDAFVAKINANGTLAWSSYLGGSSTEYGYGIALDAGGNAWVTGYTTSSDWISGGFDVTYNGHGDGFVAKINANGTLAWSSYLGGSDNDWGYGIAVDASGNAWVTGVTHPRGWGGVLEGYGFVDKINANGTLAWSSYFGSRNIALDAGGDVWMTGGTSSPDWAVRGFDVTYNGGGDGFVAKINPHAPIALDLSSSTIGENQPAGTVVGSFSTVDSDGGDTFTYSLVGGAGSTDNAAFQVVGGQLLTAASFDYDTKSRYIIRVRATDQSGLMFERPFTIDVTDVNETPTGVALSNMSVSENQVAGTAVGTLSTTDPDTGDSFTYSLVSGTGSTDNGSFTISGNQLLTAARFNYEAKRAYVIRVRSTDAGGLWYERGFTINVTNVNEAPTEVSLFLTSVNEGQLPGTVVSSIMTSDPDIFDTFDTFTFTLVSGVGADDNASFTIEGSELKTTAIFSAAAKSSYLIRIRATDAGGLWIERAFEITVTTSGVPGVVWSSYLGGSGYDGGSSIALDASGNVWVAGSTRSSGWTIGGFDTSQNGDGDAFVAKINADGTLAWSSYLGGSNWDGGSSIALDDSGNAWVTGQTNSSGWTSGGFDTSFNGGYDTFVAKINADGTLAWSSYLGGSGDDGGNSIAVDADGNAWVTGSTFSSDWTSGGFDTSFNGGYDAFVAKINATGTLAWSSYLGGSNYDFGYGIAPDASGNAWVTGYTVSAGWTVGGFDTSFNGGYDAFVAKIDANGTLAWSSYMGGSGYDEGRGIALDASGNAWVTGLTYSSGWTVGGFDVTYNGGDGDAFVAKINANGTLAWSSYLGGSDDNCGNSIALDAGGNAWMTGQTSGGAGGSGAYGFVVVAKIDASGTLAWSSYLGGSNWDEGYGIALDAGGDVWVTGWTNSSGWTSGGFDVTYNGDRDGFVAKISVDHAPTALDLSSSMIGENQPAGTVVGSFSTGDSDPGDTFTYSLVGGAGSTDNGAFQVVGGQLLTAASFDYETKSSYSIRVRATDQSGLMFERVLTINVTDVDDTAPTVTAVYVRGSSWDSGYLSFLQANLGGSSSTYGYAIPTGSGAAQLQTLPWRNLNRISIAFSEDVSIAQAQFAIVGSVGSYSVSGFAYSSIDHVATWSLSAAIGPDKLYVAVPGSGASLITDAAGNVLDGEWSNPSSYSDASSSDSFPSGNGVAGGDFAFRFDVLPGDSSGGSLGKVNVADALQTKGRSGLPVTLSTYRSDFDGNNAVNVADMLYVRSKSNIYSLPVNPPVLPVFGPVFSQVSLLQGNCLLSLW